MHTSNRIYNTIQFYCVLWMRLCATLSIFRVRVIFFGELIASSFFFILLHLSSSSFTLCVCSSLCFIIVWFFCSTRNLAISTIIIIAILSHSKYYMNISFVFWDIFIYKIYYFCVSRRITQKRPSQLLQNIQHKGSVWTRWFIVHLFDGSWRCGRTQWLLAVWSERQDRLKLHFIL